MGRKALVFEAARTGYAIEQVADDAMTVRELRSFLSDFDDNALVILSHDNGYTYGSLDIYESDEREENKDGEWEYC